MKGKRAETAQSLDLVRKLVREHATELTEEQLEAFDDMVEKGRPLTDKQAEWVGHVADRLGINSAKNLFSSMSREEQERHRKAVQTKLPWETGAIARPLKPPGRST